MKRLIINFSIFSLIFAGFMWMSCKEGDRVKVYAEKNHNGITTELKKGVYANIQYNIASLDIPDGLCVKLYRDEKFGGGFLSLEESQNDLTQSGWFDNIIKVIVEKYVEDEPLVKNYNYVLGTQVFNPLYGFRYDDWTYEAAEEIYKMGSNVLKTFDHQYSKILDAMDFTYIYLYALYNPPWLRSGVPPFISNDILVNEEFTKSLYGEMYEFVKSLLTDYNDTGKTFYLGHWEGDWYLIQDYNTDKKELRDNFIQAMTVWLNARQKAIEDAKRDTPHSNVNVWGYTEANRTIDIERIGAERLVNTVLPHTTVDYLSYSAYDIQELSSQEIKKHIDYMDQMIPVKNEVPNPGKRVFIGEAGWPAFLCEYNQERHNTKNIDKYVKFFDAGVSQILHWEMYSNEQDENGVNRGYWLIDDKGQKWKLYYSFKAFYCNAKEYVRAYISTHGKTPEIADFNTWASAFLQTLR
jgi:hypothetical protein